jgi:outer membrane protein assembly factor BamB
VESTVVMDPFETSATESGPAMTLKLSRVFCEVPDSFVAASLSSDANPAFRPPARSKTFRLRAVLLFLISQLPLSAAMAENWPCWRGPRGDGTSAETNVPTTWNGITGENVAWKSKLRGTGHASPVIWNDRIFLSSCEETTGERILTCLDQANGETVWQKVVAKSKLETKHQLNSYASGTPATDGKTVYVSFLIVDGHEIPAPNVGSERNVTPGQILVAAFDFSGNELWHVTIGDFISAHGFCSSPVIHENLLIVNGDHDGESYVVALDRSNGQTVWKTPRTHKIRSYCTPIIRDIAGRTQMVMSGSKQVVSLDPKTGDEIWRVEGPTEQFVSSMVADDQSFYLTAGFPTHHVMAINPDGSGDVTASHVRWQSEEAKCYVPSPVLTGPHLFVADDRGTVNCFETATGKRLWQDRLGKHYSASLLTANGLVYFTADDGVTSIVRPGEKLDVVSRNELGEYTWSSPAIANGRIYIRGEHHLFAIGNP